MISWIRIYIQRLLIHFVNFRLKRRVRALSAATFGSQQSDLNRAGVSKDEVELPNTNAYAVQGSNPIWTTEAPEKFQDMDTDR